MALKGGAKSAFKNFKAFYGAREGVRIFWAYADEHGKGKTREARARNAFRRKR